MSSRSLQVWLRIQALVWLWVLLLLGMADAVADSPNWHALIGFGSVLSLASLVSVLHFWPNAADLVTLGRSAAIFALVAFAPRPLQWTGWVIAALACLADLLDGKIARASDPTDHGAHLDMECDQLVVFGLAVLVVTGGGGSHVLLLPAMRWLFVLAAWYWKIPAHEPKPVDGDNRRGRLICAAVVMLLLLALIPRLLPFVGNLATFVAVMLLGWSFREDMNYLLENRRYAARR
jgi:phosphatidylglycerophosphate synthase